MFHQTRYLATLLLVVCWTGIAQAQSYDAARDAYEAGDFTRSLAILEPLADGGDGRAINLLGVMHEFGDGVAQNTVRAIELYERAAELGNAHGWNNLGLLYQNGAPGLPPDMARAGDAYERGVAMGHVGALNNLGAFLENGHAGPPDWVRILDLYERAHAGGDLDATVNIASLYFDGRGVPQDQVRAVEYLRLAVAEGFPRAYRF